MSELIQIIVKQEIDRLKQAGFVNVSVSRFTKNIESPCEEILIGNDVVIIERVSFDANHMLDNNNMLMVAASSPVAHQEEQFANAESLSGFVAKVKVNFWIHANKNHMAGYKSPHISPLKVHFVRLSPSK